MTSHVEPFEIAYPQRALDDLADRLARTRFADDFANDGWNYGVPASYLRELVAYWHDEYNWRAHEAAMNRYANFRVDLDDVPIHFVHERGRGPAPVPIVLTHGWPWTFWDYEHVIGPLTDPAAHGGDPADAFHVVVPSLPGTAFSSPLRTPSIGVTQTADLWVRLMRTCSATTASPPAAATRARSSARGSATRTRRRSSASTSASLHRSRWPRWRPSATTTTHPTNTRGTRNARNRVARPPTWWCRPRTRRRSPTP